MFNNTSLFVQTPTASIGALMRQGFPQVSTPKTCQVSGKKCQIPKEWAKFPTKNAKFIETTIARNTMHDKSY